MLNFKYIDFLPILPEEIVTEIISSTKNMNQWASHRADVYQLFECTQKLYDFIDLHLSELYVANVQLIKNTLPIHVDIGRLFVFNYIIETGGDNAHTIFYSKNNDDYTVIESHCIEPFKWHRLNVSTPHSVSTILPHNQRVSLSIFLCDADNPFK
jgi:hypothetical protein